MPNFWTRTVQKIKETLSGPRTNDTELILKLNQMKEYEQALKKLKDIIVNFSQYFQTISSYNRDINECVYLLYNTDDFKEFSDILISVHADNNQQLQSLTDNVTKLYQNIINWDNLFDEIKEKVKFCEDSRKVYDHYEKKLEKLEDKKNEMMKEGKLFENCDFYKVIVRNEEKFMKSKEDYINKAVNAYDIMERLNTDKYYVANPLLLTLFNTEFKIFECFSRKYFMYQNIEEKLNLMFQKYIESNKNKKSYNPMVFMKNPNLDENFIKSNEKCFQKIHINKEECKVYSENRISDKHGSKNNNNMLINFDDIIYDQKNNNNYLQNDIFSNFKVNYGEDKSQINNNFSHFDNRDYIPKKTDSRESFKSKLSQFPSYKSVIGENIEVIDIINPFEIVNNNSSVVVNIVNDDSDESKKSKKSQKINLFDVLERSNRENNNSSKRKGTNLNRELVDPFEGFY